jgi:uncharacterized membrane protein YeaQ/YmgE (transglycosylase-associated protein family)
MLIVIIAWLLIGLVVGGLGRLLVPGRNHVGIWLTILIGIVGSVAGGATTRVLVGSGHDLISFVLSLLVAAILVGLIGGRRRAGGPRR